MEKDIKFLVSLEKYFWKTLRRSPLSWHLLGLMSIFLVILTSIVNVKNTLVGAKDSQEAIIFAVNRGDYQTAQKMFISLKNLSYLPQVLGVETNLENVVYPELILEKRIKELEGKLLEYPGDREIYLTLAGLYDQIAMHDKADEFRELARILDPNNLSF